MAAGANQPSAEPDAPRIDGYEDLVCIGRGGYSTVYRAVQPRYERPVAVKVLKERHVDERVRRKFERECAMTGRLTGHPNVVTVLDSGVTEEGSLFITTDYYAKGSLADQLDHDGTLDVETTLATGVKIAGALETAHRAGVLHRDVKPQNILVSAFDEPALGDFGISTLALSNSDSLVANAVTPAYAPPELVGGEGAEPASDVYSLASTLYALLVGSAPYLTEPSSREDGIVALIGRILNDPLPPIDRPDVPPAVREVLEVALAKRSSDRYDTPRAFAEALQDAQQASGLAPTSIVCPNPEQAWGGPSADAEPAGTGTYEPPADPLDLVEIRLHDRTDGHTRLIVSFEELLPPPATATGTPDGTPDSTPADTTPDRIVIAFDDEDDEDGGSGPPDPEATTHRTGPLPRP